MYTRHKWITNVIESRCSSVSLPSLCLCRENVLFRTREFWWNCKIDQFNGTPVLQSGVFITRGNRTGPWGPVHQRARHLTDFPEKNTNFKENPQNFSDAHLLDSISFKNKCCIEPSWKIRDSIEKYLMKAITMRNKKIESSSISLPIPFYIFSFTRL